MASGQPSFLKCAKCRIRNGNLKATGRSRPLPPGTARDKRI